MPLLWTENIDNVGTIGLWKIEEDEDTLLHLRPISKEEETHILHLKAKKKRKQRLAYRILLQEILQKDFLIRYDVNGKPFLEGEKLHLSVSHSGEYAAVFISPIHLVGIDIEKIRGNMPTLASHFLSKIEMKEIDTQNNELLHIYWGAKECLYKMYSDLKPLFSEHLSLQTFNPSVIQHTTAYISINDFKAKHLVYFRKIENTMLVYAY